MSEREREREEYWLATYRAHCNARDPRGELVCILFSTQRQNKTKKEIRMSRALSAKSEKEEYEKKMEGRETWSPSLPKRIIFSALRVRGRKKKGWRWYSGGFRNNLTFRYQSSSNGASVLRLAEATSSHVSFVSLLLVFILRLGEKFYVVES